MKKVKDYSKRLVQYLKFNHEFKSTINSSSGFFESSHTKSEKVCKRKIEWKVSQLSDESCYFPNCSIVRFEQEYPHLSKIWQFTGIYLVEWREDARGTGGFYVPNKSWFTVSYVIVFFLLLLGIIMGIITGTNFTNDNKVALQDVLEMGFLVFTVSVVPSIQAYSMKLLLFALPEVMSTIGRISYLLKDYRPPNHTFVFMCSLGVLNEKFANSVKEYKKRGFNKNCWVVWVPSAAIVVSIVIVTIVLITTILISVVDNSCLTAELEAYIVISTTCLIHPINLTVFSLFLFGWAENIYEALGRKFLELIKKNSSVSFTYKRLDNKMLLEDISEFQQLLDDFVYLTRDIHSRFSKFILSISLFTFVSIALFSCIKLFKDLRMILFLGPLFESFYFSAVMCSGAERVVDQVINSSLY